LAILAAFTGRELAEFAPEFIAGFSAEFTGSAARLAVVFAGETASGAEPQPESKKIVNINNKNSLSRIIFEFISDK
jgi:hypothetical protein